MGCAWQIAVLCVPLTSCSRATRAAQHLEHPVSPY